MDNTMELTLDAIEQKKQMMEAVKTMMDTSMYNTNEKVRGLNNVDGFDPSVYMIALKDGWGDLYLDVNMRTLWYRLVNPNGKIDTRLVQLTVDVATFEAKVYADRNDPENAFLANSHGQRGASDGAAFLEWAETSAIGRALSRAGFGCQFSDLGNDADPSGLATGDQSEEVKGSFDGNDSAVVTTMPTPATTDVPAKPTARKRRQSAASKEDAKADSVGNIKEAETASPASSVVASDPAKDTIESIEGQLSAEEIAAPPAVVQQVAETVEAPGIPVQQAAAMPPPAPVQIALGSETVQPASPPIVTPAQVAPAPVQVGLAPVPVQMAAPGEQEVAGVPVIASVSPTAVAPPVTAAPQLTVEVSQSPAPQPTPVAATAPVTAGVPVPPPFQMTPAVQVAPVAPVAQVAPAPSPAAAPADATAIPMLVAAAAPVATPEVPQTAPTAPAVQLASPSFSPEIASKFTPNMTVEQIMATMTLEEAKAVIVDTGKNNGRSMAEIAATQPASIAWYLHKYDGKNNLMRASARILLDAGTKYQTAS